MARRAGLHDQRPEFLPTLFFPAFALLVVAASGTRVVAAPARPWHFLHHSLKGAVGKIHWRASCSSVSRPTEGYPRPRVPLRFPPAFVLIFAVVVLQVRRFVLRLVNLEVITGTAADQHHRPDQEQRKKWAVCFFGLGFGFRLGHFLHGFGGLRLRFGDHFLGWFLALFGKRQKVIHGYSVEEIDIFRWFFCLSITR